VTEQQMDIIGMWMKIIDNQKDRLENIEDVKKEENDKTRKKILP